MHQGGIKTRIQQIYDIWRHIAASILVRQLGSSDVAQLESYDDMWNHESWIMNPYSCMVAVSESVHLSICMILTHVCFDCNSLSKVSKAFSRRRHSVRPAPPPHVCPVCKRQCDWQGQAEAQPWPLAMLEMNGVRRMRKTDNGDIYTNSYLVSWNNETIAVELGFVNFSSHQIKSIISFGMWTQATGCIMAMAGSSS